MRLPLLLMLVAIAYSASIVNRRNRDGTSICYECLGSICMTNPYNKTCVTAFGCFTATEIVGNEYYHHKGCYKHPFVRLIYCDRNITTDLSTCCDGNFCNDDEFLSIPAHWTPNIPTQSTPSIPNQWTLSIPYHWTSTTTPKTENKTFDKIEEIILTRPTSYHAYILPIAITVVAGIACYYTKKKAAKNRRRQSKGRIVSRYDHTPTPNVTFEGFLSSGSGSGLPTLNQRCLAQDVALIDCIGQGRYGEVWKGVWHGENVAVKIFSSHDEASWKNEVDIYTNIALYHENVLGFKGSVIATRSGVTEMWLLTAFHQQGSLYDYLLDRTVTPKQVMNFSRSICSGLLHLHTEIFGAKGKPAIAHRDMKTRNILLTLHGTCVIADFGLAVVKDHKTSSDAVPVNYRVGTKRYMAPEILDESMNVKSFDSFKRADIYAFGLILWEVCWRSKTHGTAETYRPPYEGCVPSDPDFEDMKKVVCIESKRPEIPDTWESNKTFNDLATLMKECWHKNPEIRPTVCRVKKTLDKINVVMQEMQLAARCV